MVANLEESNIKRICLTCSHLLSLAHKCGQSCDCQIKHCAMKKNKYLLFTRLYRWLDYESFTGKGKSINTSLIIEVIVLVCSKSSNIIHQATKYAY